MSVRAYRVIKVEHASEDSFNLWHDEKLRDFLNTNYDFSAPLNDDGCGMSELPIEALEKALKEVELSEDVREALQNDIEVARKAGDEYLTYDCF
jgi:hypothetical protein